MELIKKNFHMLSRKSEAVNQVTFDEIITYRIQSRMWAG